MRGRKKCRARPPARVAVARPEEHRRCRRQWQGWEDTTLSEELLRCWSQQQWRAGAAQSKALLRCGGPPQMEVPCRSSTELLAKGRQLLAVSRAKQARVAHLDTAPGQDVLHAKRTVNELLSGPGAELGFTRARGAIPEGDLIVLDLHDAAMTDRDAKDVRSEILEGGETIADGLGARAGLLCPCKTNSPLSYNDIVADQSFRVPVQ